MIGDECDEVMARQLCSEVLLVFNALNMMRSPVDVGLSPMQSLGTQSRHGVQQDPRGPFPEDGAALSGQPHGQPELHEALLRQHLDVRALQHVLARLVQAELATFAAGPAMVRSSEVRIFASDQVIEATCQEIREGGHPTGGGKKRIGNLAQGKWNAEEYPRGRRIGIALDMNDPQRACVNVVKAA